MVFGKKFKHNEVDSSLLSDTSIFGFLGVNFAKDHFVKGKTINDRIKDFWFKLKVVLFYYTKLE